MGRLTLMAVLALSIAMSVMAPSTARFANEAYENYIRYFSKSTAHNIATSGANIGANQVFEDPTWRTGYSNIAFDGGWFTVKAANMPLPDSARIKITSTSKYVLGTSLTDTLRDTVICILEPSAFSKYAVYLKSMGSASWATGDTVWGPCHINGTLSYSGNPVFWGKTTALSGKSGSGSPKFYGGFQSGVNVPLPLDLSKTTAAATAAGKTFTAPSGSGQFEMRFTFNNDSTFNYSDWRGTTKVDTFSNVKISTLSTNGVIWVKDGDVKVKGTYKGQYTIVCTGTSPNGVANINGNILAATDPSKGSSSDLFGLVVDNNITIPLPPGYSNGSPAPQHDFTIQAALFCRTGQFSATLESHMGVQGAVTVYGSLTSASIGAFSVFSGSTMQYGYQNHFLFDDRFYDSAPPFYPNSGTYQTISWRE